LLDTHSKKEDPPPYQPKSKITLVREREPIRGAPAYQYTRLTSKKY
jgi:hypothetical protein